MEVGLSVASEKQSQDGSRQATSASWGVGQKQLLTNNDYMVRRHVHTHNDGRIHLNTNTTKLVISKLHAVGSK